MTAKRFQRLLGFVLLCAGWAHAQSSDDTFNLDFFASDGAWIPGASFDVTSSDTSLSIYQARRDGFTQNSFCPDGNWERCICDPGVKLQVPDQPPPTPFDVSTTITIGSDGTFDENFINVGPNIETFLLTTTDFNENETYTCSSDFFQFCGFKITGDAPILNVIFTDPINPNGISTAVPEPKQYILLLIALAGAVVVYRVRSRRLVD